MYDGRLLFSIVAFHPGHVSGLMEQEFLQEEQSVFSLS